MARKRNSRGRFAGVYNVGRGMRGGIHGYSGMGSMIRVRRLSGGRGGFAGLGELSNPNTAAGALLPVFIGGGVTLLTMVGIRQFLKPKTAMGANAVKYAPLIGTGAGILTSLALWSMASQSAGLSAMTAAGTLGLGITGMEALAKANAARPATTSGVGAIVPEYGMAGRRGTSAIVMEPAADRGWGMTSGRRGTGTYGEVVSLGAVNPNAFGTPGFSV